MNYKITKSNAIVNSSYRFSLNEMRIVLYGLSHIDPMAKEFPLFHRIHIKELAEFFDIGEKDRGSFYDNIKHALLNKFWTREFSYYDEELGEIIKRQWLIEVRYGKKDGSLAYHYNPLIKKELQQLAKRFTSYFLNNIANMRSSYSIRFYEISIMYLNTSKKQKTVFKKRIKDLKHHLDISERYKNFYDFKRRVIEHARKEINKYSDIVLNYEVIKKGRSPYEIQFTITRNKAFRISKNDHSSIDTKKYQLSINTIEIAKKIISKSTKSLDIYTTEQEFYNFVKIKGSPDNLDAAFIGFVKQKIL